MSPFTSCSPSSLDDFTNAHEAHALLDVRELGEFVSGHMLLASNAPLSVLELAISSLVPCTSVPVLVMDSGAAEDSRAQAAAERLFRMGYSKTAVLEGGVRGLEKSGSVLVNGLFCLTKGFAERMEIERRTPLVSPAEIAKRLADGEKIAFIDVRAFEECSGKTLPGAVNAPGCEAVYRLEDLAPDPEQQVVVTCAARARGVIWAQALKDCDIPNPVAALLGGTMNWERNGQMLETNSNSQSPSPSGKAVEAAAKRAQRLAKKHAIPSIDANKLAAWRAESDRSPLYVFDVRSRAEYEAGHLRGSRNVTGNELVLRLEDHVAVRNARIVLVDDTEARSVVSAYLLRQMGLLNVSFLKGGLNGVSDELLTGGQERALPTPCHCEPAISAHDLAELLESGASPLIINVELSDKHRSGHIPSAAWVSRAFLEEAQKEHAEAKTIIFTSDQEIHARLAASDAREIWPESSIYVLANGTAAWNELGLPIETGMATSYGPEMDKLTQSSADPEAKVKAMDAYFDWDNNIARQIKEDGGVTFRFP